VFKEPQSGYLVKFYAWLAKKWPQLQLSQTRRVFSH